MFFTSFAVEVIKNEGLGTFNKAFEIVLNFLGRVDNCYPRLRASACPRYLGDAQVKNKTRLKH